ncbi:hypothetical protein L211DRAFT_464464 [Terfezia boudieri ATCC MYA-4762]|uniref:Uncharacterized protein n=1 Tax=Terfezia boudieri ATCC MYA-4762 TaxID=1051890 RepID=A0A3N4LY80_9PEZI|nr:hypothetical protein L211DRAFT_464464 [Terfezia boudieri ATCC MYA-4762]
MPAKHKRKNNPGQSDRGNPPHKTRLPVTRHPEPPPLIPAPVAQRTLIPAPAQATQNESELDDSDEDTPTPAPRAPSPIVTPDGRTARENLSGWFQVVWNGLGAVRKDQFKNETFSSEECDELDFIIHYFGENIYIPKGQPSATVANSCRMHLERAANRHLRVLLQKYALEIQDKEKDELELEVAEKEREILRLKEENHQLKQETDRLKMENNELRLIPAPPPPPPPPHTFSSASFPIRTLIGILTPTTPHISQNARK